MVRIFRHYIPKSVLVVGLTEALILFTSFYFAVHMDLAGLNPTPKLLVGALWSKAALYTLVLLLCIASMGLYERGLRDDLRGIWFRLGLAFLVGLVVMAGFIHWARPLSIGQSAFTVAFVYSAVGVVTFRTLVHRFADQTPFKRRVLVLGAGTAAAQLGQLRRKTDWQDLILLGYVPVPGQEILISEDRQVRVDTTLLDVARRLGAHEIVVALEDRRERVPVNDILDCKMSGIKIIELVTFFEQQTGKIQLDSMSPSVLIFADGFVQAILKSFVHRLFDGAVSFGMLLLTWPLMLAAAAAIFIESGGREPILYRQARVGRNGREFEILKFRSMHTGAEGSGTAQWASPQDARVTRVGALLRKTRIDELPQLINVLKGEMSFVGPRPERPEFVEALKREIPFYDLRHRVNPGITGWAQIRYPYGASVKDAKEKLQYDLYYIKNYSLFLDMMILIQTAQVILWGKGAR